ncbi:MarC family protein [Pontiella sp.]|uniref:MarC family protein n=1 Tax=Pontiella sp. TaxID=2837462 RepID=UPI003563C217
MADFIHRSLMAFIRLFVALDIIGVLPIFYGLTQDATAPERSRIARRAVLTASVLGVAFFVAGKLVFRLLNITEHDFRVGGGLILLVLAVSDLLFSGESSRAPGADVGVVPIGVPLILGPAALTTLLVLVPACGYGPTLLALVANLLIVLLVFRLADRIVARLQLAGVRAVSKITSLFLAAIAVMMIRLGISGMLGTAP